jgi:ribose/xylose/arabinose/galactoside ABC-type transport system permease subunit
VHRRAAARRRDVFASFLSPEYILLQLKVGAFLGIIATGLMMVILLGHIDLSLPWTITVGAMMACAVAGHGELGAGILAIPVGIGCGVLIGIVNGILVALLRIPSMIATLATNAVAQGIMIVYTGGSSPQDSAPHAMRWLAAGWLVPGVPNAVALWVLIGGATMFLLSRTTFGRTLYAIGNTERAAYLSGINTRLVTVAAFAVCGGSRRSAACCSRVMRPKRRSRWAMLTCCRRSRRSCSAARRFWAAGARTSARWPARSSSRCCSRSSRSRRCRRRDARSSTAW